MPVSGIYCEMFDSTGSNTAAATAGINWLADNGGGTLLAPTRRAIQDAFGLDTNKEFKNFEGRLESKGITLQWPRRGGRALGAVFAFYCTTDQLSALAEQDGVEKVLFLPWSGQDKRWFEATFLGIKDPEVEDLPEEVDKVLRFLASAAAGYSTGLKWNEEERFKAELMASWELWRDVDPVDIRARCIELGMHPADADLLKKYAEDRRGGKTFRPRASASPFPHG